MTGPGSNAPVEIDVEVDGGTLHVGTLWISQRGPAWPGHGPGRARQSPSGNDDVHH
ncbi:MAG: hypothetical protein ACR2M5_15140 [Nakamurella sp.]